MLESPWLRPSCDSASACEGSGLSVGSRKAGGGELLGTSVTGVDDHICCSLPVA